MVETSSKSYWLNWRFLLLASGLVVIAGTAVRIIWKYEGSPRSGKQEGDSKKKPVGFLYKDEAWTTCHKAIHPAWLLAYRTIMFFFLLWTFSLVTIYFGLGSSLSIYGCILYRKGVASGKVCSVDEERNDSPTLEKNASLPDVSKDLSSDEETDDREPAGGHGFKPWKQPPAEMQDKAAYDTPFWWGPSPDTAHSDCVYWGLIYPIFLPDDLGLKFVVVGMHSLNAATLFGDVLLNSLEESSSLMPLLIRVNSGCNRWPYFFMDLAYEFAPLLYVIAGVAHLPCYGVFALVIALKCWLARLFKWLIRKLSGDKQ
ncbi:putative signal recognition particle receptor subunit beta-like isoform X1 [Capsicum annuum]|nr:putative signal recognition particle receptor subunit beta-like isoform X1 [Capsicum annuum]